MPQTVVHRSNCCKRVAQCVCHAIDCQNNRSFKYTPYYIKVGRISDISAFTTSLLKCLQILDFQCSFSDHKKFLVLLLHCTAQYIKVMLFPLGPEKSMLDKYLDENQKSEGHRTRILNCWNFRVSAKNRILNLKLL